MQKTVLALSAALTATLALAACGEAEDSASTAAVGETAALSAAEHLTTETSVAEYPEDGTVIYAAQGEEIEIRLEHPSAEPGWTTDEAGTPVIQAVQSDVQPGPSGFTVSVWTYRAEMPGETSVRFYRADGTDLMAQELESRTLIFRVTD